MLKDMLGKKVEVYGEIKSSPLSRMSRVNSKLNVRKPSHGEMMVIEDGKVSSQQSMHSMQPLKSKDRKNSSKLSFQVRPVQNDQNARYQRNDAVASDGQGQHTPESKQTKIRVEDVEKYCRPQQLCLYDPVLSGFKYTLIGLVGLPE